MTLPPWLWRILRSGKTRRAGIVGVYLLIAAVAGFYPVTNWWGWWAFERAEAKVVAAGLPVRSREIPVEEVTDSFFRQPAFLAEKALPEAERLGGCEALRPAQPRSAAQPSPYSLRRVALLDAIRQARPLEPGNDVRLRLPDEDAQLALHLADFLQEDATFAMVTGENAAALESFQACSMILSELMKPGVRHSLHSRLAGDFDRMVTDFVLRAGCRGFSEGQLVKIDEVLDRMDFESLWESRLRELPGECVRIHREIARRQLPGPRPKGNSSNVFGHWEWDIDVIQGRAALAWDLWKPWGIHEKRMARGLRELTEAVVGTEPEAEPGVSPLVIREIRITRGLGRFVGASGSAGMGLHEYQLGSSDQKGKDPQAKIVLARHLIAIERHRARHGSVPWSFEALDDDLRRGLPPDPWTGKPLNYALDEKGRNFTLSRTARWNIKAGRDSWQFPVTR